MVEYNLFQLAGLWVERYENENDNGADDGGGEEEAKQTSVDDYGHLSPLGGDVCLTSGRLHPRRDQPQLPQDLAGHRQSSGARAAPAFLRAGRVGRFVDVVTGGGGQDVAEGRSHVGRRQRNVVGQVEAKTDAVLASQLKLVTAT